jgi:hypothetical protein
MKLSFMTLFVPLIAFMTMSTAAPLSVDDSGLTELTAVNTRLIPFSQAFTNTSSTASKYVKKDHKVKPRPQELWKQYAMKLLLQLRLSLCVLRWHTSLLIFFLTFPFVVLVLTGM